MTNRNLILILALLLPVALLQAQILPIEESRVCNTPDGLPRNIGRGGTPVGPELVKITLSSPEARCNDGSPAVIYVRSAAPGVFENGEPAANKWVIYLQGGHGCNDAVSCRDRWCAYDNYDASKMSSRFAPDTVAANGIFRRDATNKLGARNQVFAYYCSSDWWVRSADDFLMLHPDDPDQGFTMDMKGSDIVEAIFDELETGVVDGAGRALPDIRSADDILFVGASAGANGIRHNADRMRARLSADNPSLVFRAVTDATYSPLSQEARELPLREEAPRQEPTVFRPDLSCVLSHPGAESLCLDAAFVQLNHLTTPFFLRMDLTDPVEYNFVDYDAYPTRADLARELHDQVSLMRTIREEGGAIERDRITAAPGVFAPQCGVHVALTNNASFFRPKVRSDGATAPMSFHDTLWNWMQGQGPIFQIADKPPPIPAIPTPDPLCSSRESAPEFVSVNSAAFAAGEPAAPNSIVSGFGVNLAPSTVVAETLPLPTELAGTTVEITDSAGQARLAPLFFVSRGQINYLVPPATALGAATVTVRTAAGQTIPGELEIARISPGLYSAQSSGTGVAAAFYLRIAEDGTRTQELVYDPATGQPVPIDLGPPGDQVYLLLFGTGFRNGAEAQIEAHVGGVPVPVLGIAPQPQFAGLDQGNIGPLSPELAGRGSVAIDLTIAGESANRVGVAIR